MGAFLLRVIINGAAVAVASFFIPGIELRGLLTVLVVGVVFGVVNAVIRPVALAITCLLNVLTLGLFILVVNAAMLALTAWLTGLIADATGLPLVFRVNGFLAAFLGAIVAGIVSFLLIHFLHAD